VNSGEKKILNEKVKIKGYLKRKKRKE